MPTNDTSVRQFTSKISAARMAVSADLIASKLSRKEE